MERSDDVENPQWTAKLEEYGQKALTTNRIEGLGQVHKENVQVLILLAALFLDLSYGEYHVDCPSVSSEGTLTLRDDIMQEVPCVIQFSTIRFKIPPGILKSEMHASRDCHRMFCHLCSCTGGSYWRS